MKYLFMFLLLIACTPEPVVEEPPKDLVCYEGYCFEVELALTQFEQASGLSDRHSLEPDRGMLFVFQMEGIYQFWMKDTYINLDIIWIDSNNQVIFIKDNAEPCTPDECPTINPAQIAKYVLEINGGMAESIGLEKGDIVDIQIQKIFE